MVARHKNQAVRECGLSSANAKMLKRVHEAVRVGGCAQKVPYQQKGSQCRRGVVAACCNAAVRLGGVGVVVCRVWYGRGRWGSVGSVGVEPLVAEGIVVGRAGTIEDVLPAVWGCCRVCQPARVCKATHALTSRKRNEPGERRPQTFQREPCHAMAMHCPSEIA